MFVSPFCCPADVAIRDCLNSSAAARRHSISNREMRKPSNSCSNEDSENLASSMRSRLPAFSACNSRGDLREDSLVHSTSSRLLRTNYKLGGGIPHEVNGLVLRPCKHPTVINFEFKSQGGTKNRKLDIAGFNSFFTGFSLNKAHKMESTTSPLPNFSSSSREVKDPKATRRESLNLSKITTDNFGIENEYYRTGLKDPIADASTMDQNVKKSAKSQKIKLRQPSKSMGLNIDDSIRGKKKLKPKRPMTSGVELIHDAVSPPTGERILTPRLVISKTSSLRSKEKENFPPLNKSTTSFGMEKEEIVHVSSSGKTCPKCNTISQKLKAQVQMSKTLQRQNGCLENIVTQKRNLVEQLTRQVRTLVRENQQLTKSSQKLPLENGLNGLEASPVDKQSTTNLPVCSDILPCDSDLDTDISINGIKNYDDNVFSCNDSSDSMDHYSNSGTSETPRQSTSADKLAEAEQLLANLNTKCEEIQQNYEQIKKENEEINRFLTDLLYTLNARGYESITDHDGNMIDLYRCRGETFLDLKGRDARLRIPAKRLAPQETLLKAVIGSQERIIQNLILQLEDRQKDSMLGRRFSLETFNGDEGSRNAALEGDILTLLSLLEGACQRSPEVFSILKEQHNFDSQVKANAGVNINMGNAIVEAVLDRCQKVINNLTPPATPTRIRRARDPMTGKFTNQPQLPSRLGNTEGIVRGVENPVAALPGTYMRLNCVHPAKHPLYSTKSDSDFSRSPPAPLQTRLQALPEIPARSRLPQISRSNTQTCVLTGNLPPARGNNATLSSQRPSVQRSKGASNNSADKRNNPMTSGNQVVAPIMSVPGDKTLPYLNGDRCPYCSRQFSSTASLAEINAHMELHLHQTG